MTIAAWLQQNYTYSLDEDNSGRNRYRDPIFRFLFHTRKGHCELFASACTMMLRSAGLPARYVTGFLCRRKLNTEKPVWYSTGADAHAWTEVYLPDEQCWIRLDATPGGNGNMEIMVTEPSFSEHLFLLKSRLSSYFRHGRFLVLWDEIARHPWQYLMILPPAAGIISVIIFLKRKRRNTPVRKLDRRKRLAARSFSRLAEKIMRKTGIRRKKNETFREWVNRLEEPERTQVLPALHDYEKKRFSD